LTNLSSFVTVPNDFETDKPRYSADFKTFNKQEIEESRNKEKEIWWK